MPQPRPAPRVPAPLDAGVDPTADPTADPTPLKRSQRIEVRASGVHGRGVYAVAPLKAGDKLIEYKGEHISWDVALDRHPHDPSQPDHTFYFHLETGGVIDAAVDGNRARWINHACSPNCEAREADGRVFIHAVTDISPGEELFYDYGLVIEERYTPELKKRFECRCGTPGCRGTMLAPKEKAPKEKAPKEKALKGKKSKAKEKTSKEQKASNASSQRTSKGV